MVNEIEYEELIEKEIPIEALKNYILETEEIYKREYGWNVGEFKIETINQNTLKVTVDIAKYKINEDEELKTTYIVVIKKEDYNKELANLYEAYKLEQGWIIEEPKINEINKEEILVRIPLTKKVPSRTY